MMETTTAGTMSLKEVEKPPPTTNTPMVLHMSPMPLTMRLTLSPLVMVSQLPQVHSSLKPHGPTMTFSSNGLVPMKSNKNMGLAPMATTSRMAPPAPVAAASYGRGTAGEQ